MKVEPFPRFDEHTAPQQSRQALAEVRADFGMIPNLESVMAAAPALLHSYVHAWGEFSETSLSDIEQQVVYLTVNVENNCEYCVPWHSKLALDAGMALEEVNNLREGRFLENSRLNALHLFTLSIVRTRGSIAAADLQRFISAGYTAQQALEVVLGVAIKVMSNYTNALAQTPLDAEVQSLQWRKSNLRGVYTD